ncbi:GntR family transcriptional regulator [Bacteroides caccae]|uniref:GntR family transcriptional regulator n=1 Tax=Bacteroides caccae TaxID=47678 RepID=UPI0032EE47D4
MRRTDKKATFGQHSSKVTQLADTLSQAISMKEFREGDSLPSINQLSAQYGVSRDTVFKAFLDLRERGLIDSTPGKGYYVTSQVTNILLLLDEYTPFKEALYNSFIKHLPINYKVDLLFHQYNERLFNTIIRESIGKYKKYIVMNFDNEKFSTALNKINPSRLLLLDFGKFEKDKYSYICQDFDDSFYLALFTLKERMQKYLQIVFLFSKGLKHPQSSKEYFTLFCEKEGFLHEIQEDIENLTVRKGTVYIAIKQQDVVKVVKQGRLAGLKCGKDFGLLAYNDIPSYEVIDEGITSLSIDWEMVGNEAANFVLNNVPIQKYMPTEVRLRKSL